MKIRNLKNFLKNLIFEIFLNLLYRSLIKFIPNQTLNEVHEKGRVPLGENLLEFCEGDLGELRFCYQFCVLLVPPFLDPILKVTIELNIEPRQRLFRYWVCGVAL